MSFSDKITFIIKEQKANPRIRFRLMLLLFRTYNLFDYSLWRIFAAPLGFVFKIYTLLFLSIDIPLRTKIGNIFVIHHGFGIVIHRNSVIGNNVTIRHGVTLGQRFDGDGVPTVGNDVNLGAMSVLLGPIFISDGVTIPALTLIKDSVTSSRQKSD